MISQILGFSVLFILVFGGAIGAIVKFTLLGNVQTDQRSRTAEERIENSFKQEKPAPAVTKGRAASRQPAAESAWRIDGDFSNPSATT